jgi:hypothetical protein
VADVPAFTIVFGSAAMECSIWSSPGEARAGTSADLDIANEYGSGSGPVYLLAPAGDAQEGAGGPAVGIRMDSEFESPTILGAEWGGARWVGCNAHLYRLSPGLVIDREICLDSRFGSFRLDSRLDRLFVIAEAGILAVRGDGGIDWRAELDIVTDARWEAVSVLISQMDGPKVRVDLRSGSVESLPR